MISLETARKLKEAGLCWEPQAGDCFYDITMHYIREIKHVRKYDPEYKLIYTWEYFEDYLRKENGFRHDKVSLKDAVFAPRLEQLLSEIEKRGYKVRIGNTNPWEIAEGYEKYTCSLLQEGTNKRFVIVFEAGDNMIEEAAAKALLWILEREKKGGK